MEGRDLTRYGIRFDDLNRVRVIDEETENHSSDLRDTCNAFLRDTTEFQKIADSFIKIFDHVSKAVEQEKIRAIGSRNLLQTFSKQRESQTQQLDALIREKKLEGERLQAQYQSLVKLEAMQNEFIEQLILHK
ncbi:hypothetical protein TCAL_04406 [Tigriopus californicus]|uniref:Intraflagellar transport protein 20 homolog n=1 Tax=Tigriopus californicus TaxID=6832 RepID=A0A553N7E4_TIGCA|nr:intraflagellar transport protein 20 homolog [Tigriopus californicus]TRY61364.1 hypothetical protein TCAL_04406 [Tigriopus californicus]|eukprot:TCALIF_04406-PA protein Name:"Similar to ift20 Intraflagellar transport protein 20 homolog (Danio rerio)" AED:0.01 eAED:0.01 QI:0/-1/0/1/-1/1/1/0/132